MTMAIPTSRTKEKGEIRVNKEKCRGCGKCVEVCKDFSLILKDKKVSISDNPAFGCVGCGHCMAICPTSAIQIFGRTISPDDLYILPSDDNTANFDQLIGLYKRRRSVREFLKKFPLSIVKLSKVKV